MKMTLNYFLFPQHTEPKGMLESDLRCQACWYFYVLAQKQYEKVGFSIDDQFGLLEGNLWMDTHYEQTARTVAAMYNLDSPDEFAKAWPHVILEASRCGLPKPKNAYMRPLRIHIV